MLKCICNIILFFFISAKLSSQVVASFSASPISGCAPLIVQFSDLSTGGVNSWNWAFGNGNSSIGSSPATIYSTPGVYSVTLTVSNGSSTNNIIKTNYITVYNKPTANFTASSYTTCVGQPVIFSDATVIGPGAAINLWGWDFGDGITQSVSTPTISHTYSIPGNYQVSVIVTDANGCSGTAIKNITILTKPTISFTASPTFSCSAPLNVNFTNTSITSGIINYLWKFGDGGLSNSANPVHTYTSSGSYPVTLVINQNGCKDSITLPNSISIQNSNINFAISSQTICAGQNISFTNTSNPFASASNWNFGNGQTSQLQNPTATYTAAGIYTVTLSSVDVNGCSGTKTNTLLVSNSPTTLFSADTLVACSWPLTVNFTDASIGAVNYYWDFGDGNSSILQNPSHTYTSSGTFEVTLTTNNSANSCSDSLIKNNYIIISPPIANFISIPDSGCVPLPVTFSSVSASAIDLITNYIWQFGDGQTIVGSNSNPTNTYTTLGTFSPTLIVQTLNGCSDTIICNNCIKTGTLPTSNFSIVSDSVCYNLPVNFTDLSTGATGWQWLFGDGATSPMQNSTHVYADTGSYSIKLIVYNNGCADTSTIQTVVVLAPKANFSYTLSCINYFLVNFSDMSADADSLVWDFGDGVINSLNISNPTHTFTNSGTYNINLTAYNYNSGCDHSMIIPITISEPIANFTINAVSGCYPFTPIFTSTSQNALTYHWDFGDLNTFADTSIINNPSYTYINPSTNTISLIITDVNGCQDSINTQIQSLGPVPYFYADTLTGCRPFPVTFIDTTVSASPLIQWTWDFGDGTTSVSTTNDSIFHVYTIAGNYNVVMTVEDSNGCIKSIQTNNYIKPTFPLPSFAIDTFACVGNLLSFDASATNAINPTYYWDFGDGATLSSSNPVSTHTYSLDNAYLVQLTVTDGNGCDSIITETVRILKPKANFNWSILSAGCGNMQVAFQDSTLGFASSWFWDFGNGATSVLQNPNYTYTQPGSFNVTLIVTNLGGCKDTLSKDSIIVVDGPIGTYSFSPNNGCSPLNVSFIANSPNSLDYIWDFGDGTVSNSGNTIYHTYVGQGSYNPVLFLGNILSNGNQCLLPAANQTGFVNVVNTVSVVINPSILNLPADSFVLITPSIIGGILPYSYNWIPYSSISCNNCISPVIILGSGNNITYVFSVTDSLGCQGEDSIQVFSNPCINPSLIPNVFSPNGDGINDEYLVPNICSGKEYLLQIFNRWGLLIYSTDQRKSNWDGKTLIGDEAPTGTYFYLIKISDKNYKGFIELIR
jgi:gliding motility-associated-like protein